MRSYREGDEAGIAKLYQLAFGEPLDVPHWRWQYIENPAKIVTITLAEEKSEIVGQYALRPVRMKVGQDSRLAALSLDTMVHPEYRGQGMFVKLAKHLYETVAGRGIPLVYGFPNEASYHGFIARLEWKDLTKNVPLFVRPLNVRRILNQRLKPALLAGAAGWLVQAGASLRYPVRRVRVPQGCAIQERTRFDESADRLWEQASTLFPVSVVRDQQYLNWRFVAKPGDHYTLFTLESNAGLLGYVVLKTVEKFGLRLGFLVDLLALPGRPDVSHCLVSKALGYFKESEQDIINCMMLKNGPFVPALRANGFLFLPPKYHPQEMHLGVRNNTQDYPTGFISDPVNWYITWADHDDL
jgi:GNAT superfamily N-acetyltransferase